MTTSVKPVSQDLDALKKRIEEDLAEDQTPSELSPPESPSPSSEEPSLSQSPPLLLVQNEGESREEFQQRVMDAAQTSKG